MDQVEISDLLKMLHTIYIGNPTSEPELHDRLATFMPIDLSTLRNLLDKAIQIVSSPSQQMFAQDLSDQIKTIHRMMLENEREVNPEQFNYLQQINLSYQDNVNDDPQPSTSRQLVPQAASKPQNTSDMDKATPPNDNNMEQTSSDNASRKRKQAYNNPYDITKPKNIRYNTTAINTNIYPWNPSGVRGFSVNIKGPHFQKGIVTQFVKDLTDDIGKIIGIYEYEHSATIIVDREDNQRKLCEIFDKSQLGLEATPATYRFPIIKFWMDRKQTNNKWHEVIEEIKAFNLKKHSQKLFEFFKIFGSPFAQYVLVAVRVDPMIRDFIINTLHGQFWFRGRNLDVIDHFSLRRCYNCGSCRHWICSEKQEKCLRCSGPHNFRSCKATTPCCPSCKGQHEAFHITCPNLQEAINRQIEMVDYTYKNIMWLRGF
uniref:Pre-C2HC domain-containing protein n=1 Tax=Tetranychus urticae TaxID=32264 RepID=T1KU33_TETUR